MVALFRFNKWIKIDPNHRAMPFYNAVLFIFYSILGTFHFFIDFVLAKKLLAAKYLGTQLY
jgi:cytochrome c oxidase assembly factor CtaG